MGSSRQKKEILAMEDEKRRSLNLYKKSTINEAELDRDCERLDKAIKAARRHLNSLIPILLHDFARSAGAGDCSVRPLGHRRTATSCSLITFIRAEPVSAGRWTSVGHRIDDVVHTDLRAQGGVLDRVARIVQELP